MKIHGTPYRSPGTFDYRSITDTIQRSLASAGLEQPAGLMKGITDTVEQAFAASGLIPGGARPEHRGETYDGFAREVDAATGEFVKRAFTNSAGTRSYLLHVPASYAHLGAGAPLVVMLHGCSQTPEDFAAGTRMNELAERHGFLVAYPAQVAGANKGKCWNWYRTKHQARDLGEPSILAGIARQVASDYRVDPQRIFVAGMSAGAAMAVILGATYPELFAAVGAHSGLPLGAAHDLPSALAAMKNGGAQGTRAMRAVPTIVFHGCEDSTVHASNGDAIVAQATARGLEEERLRAEVHTHRSPDGRAYTRTVFADATGHPLVEHWALHETGHAWSGGSPNGSFTDPRGPDASAEMIRFFGAQIREAQPRALAYFGGGASLRS